MANDLLANADFYRERKSDIEHDQKRWHRLEPGGGLFDPRVRILTPARAALRAPVAA